MDPIHVHMISLKHVLWYPKGTMDYGLKYDVNQKINLHGYVDSNWQVVPLTGRATQVFCFSLGSSMILWFSEKKSCVGLSTAKTEYVFTCSDSCEAVWLRKLLSNLFDLQLDVTCIFYDNHSFVKL